MSAVWLCQVAGEDNYFLSHQEKFPPSINGQGPTNLPILFQVSLSDGRMQSVSYTSDDYGDNNDLFYSFNPHLLDIYQAATRPRWRTGTNTAPTPGPGEEVCALSLL